MKIAELFFHPVTFFKSLGDEGFTPSLITFLIIYTIQQVLAILVNLPQLLESPLGNLVWLSTSLAFLLFILIGLVIPFIAAAIIHVGVFVMNGQNGYLATYRVVTYSLVIGTIYSIVSTLGSALLYYSFPESTVISGTTLPILIFSGLIGLVSLIHALYAELHGMVMHQELTLGKASVAVILIPLALFLFILFIVGITVGGVAALLHLGSL